MFRKRLLLWLGLLALPSLACNLSASASPTVPPAPILQSPVLGINPVSGAPGTVITVSAAGFPAGAKVNLYLSTASSPSLQPSVEGLTVTPGGVLTFSLQLPAQIGATMLSGTIPVVLTVETADKKARANAVFMASAPGGINTTATVLPDLQPTPGDVSLGGQLYITAPAIGSVQSGGRIIVTGSGRAASNRVNVQVLDANNKILGSATATIQAASGAVGLGGGCRLFRSPPPRQAGI
jgi:hypothetical protein